jgi:hypothetical protein
LGGVRPACAGSKVNSNNPIRNKVRRMAQDGAGCGNEQGCDACIAPDAASAEQEKWE